MLVCVSRESSASIDIAWEMIVTRRSIREGGAEHAQALIFFGALRYEAVEDFVSV